MPSVAGGPLPGGRWRVRSRPSWSLRAPSRRSTTRPPPERTSYQTFSTATGVRSRTGASQAMTSPAGAGSPRGNEVPVMVHEDVRVALRRRSRRKRARQHHLLRAEVREGAEPEVVQQQVLDVAASGGSTRKVTTENGTTHRVQLGERSSECLPVLEHRAVRLEREWPVRPSLDACLRAAHDERDRTHWGSMPRPPRPVLLSAPLVPIPSGKEGDRRVVRGRRSPPPRRT